MNPPFHFIAKLELQMRRTVEPLLTLLQCSTAWLQLWE